MMELTCKNHPRAKYLTKGSGRILHFVEADPDYVRKCRPELAELPDELLTQMSNECPCPAGDLIEVSGEYEV